MHTLSVCSEPGTVRRIITVLFLTIFFQRFKVVKKNDWGGGVKPAAHVVRDGKDIKNVSPKMKGRERLDDTE